jgi:glyoxylase-like metal-dependent hydrolase (beta-lactamase superfamily II)
MRSSLIPAAGLWLLLVVTPIRAHEVRIPGSLGELSLARISDRVYVVHGMQSLPDADNKGFMSNSGIVLTDEGVVLVDSGGSAQVAQAIVARIRALTDKPVTAVFNTHVHGDHWLGNAAVRDAFPGVRIYAHERALERLQVGEAQQWLDIFMRMTGGAVTRTKPVLPDHGLEGGETLQFPGATMRVHHTGHAHTDSDVMIEVAEERLLFAGDIIEHGRAVSSDVPQDFDIAGQIAAIEYALSLPVDTYVPGHGVTGAREIPEDALRFLRVLHHSVKRYYDEGMQDYEMRDRVAADLSAFADWFGFDQLGRLISFVYQQIEAEDFR